MNINNFVVTPQQMKQLENASQSEGVSLYTLMNNAGVVLAEGIIKLIRCDKSSEITVLAGNGNNGGDGFVCAQFLKKLGFKIRVVLTCGGAKTSLSQNAFNSMTGIDCFYLDELNFEEFFDNCKVIVDCIFGTGFHGDLPESIAKLCGYINTLNCLKVACDIPSGVDAFNGWCDKNVIKCDYTYTFGGIKIGMLVQPAKQMCGVINVMDIKIPEKVYSMLANPVVHLNSSFVKTLIPERLPTSHKGDFGKLLIVAGSSRYTGAASLSTLSALRSGVGLCTLATTERVAAIVGSNVFEATFLPLKEDIDGLISHCEFAKILDESHLYSAVLIGCGLGISDNMKKLVAQLIQTINCPIILDADGINAILDRIDIIRNTRADIIVTPHPGELSRLCSTTVSDVLNRRVELSSEFAKKYGVTVVSKGSGTVIATPDGRLFVCSGGNAGLSRGGSGDVLAGMIASFSAQGLSPENACCAGVFLHSKAADNVAQKLSMQGMLPSDLISELPLVFNETDG